MEELKDEAIHHTALKLAEEIKNLSIYKSFYSDVQKLVSSPNVKKEDFKQTLQQAMKDKGLDTKLRNTVFHWVRTQSKQNKLDPLTSLQKASAQWEKRIHKSLNSMCSDLETSLAKIRPQSEQDELADKWNELSTYTLDLSKYRPVYAPKDFLEVLLTLSGYVPFTKEDEPKWEFAHLPLQVKTLDELRKVYPEWASGEPLLGVNPSMPSPVPGFATLEAERVGLGERVAALAYAPVVQEYLKRGSPQSLRARLWSLVLGSDVRQQQIAAFNQLKASVLEVDLMIDKLIFKDVQLTASNDDQYFVFEDLLYQVMLCFSRDCGVRAALAEGAGGAGGAPLTVAVRGRHAPAERLTAFPPSGVIPFHGFSMYGALPRTANDVFPLCRTYVRTCKCDRERKLRLLFAVATQLMQFAMQNTLRSVFFRLGIWRDCLCGDLWSELYLATPFCYLYDDPVQLYYTFRAFYIRYWHRLHYISTHPQGIVSLCLLYERLLEANEPLLWIHFRNININPIRVVFKWLMRAFSGHLPPDQLLLLWDAILGYDSLEILPLLALAILSFRKENIFQVNTLQNVDAVLADLSTISVIPLLQLALMKS